MNKILILFFSLFFLEFVSIYLTPHYIIFFVFAYLILLFGSIFFGHLSKNQLLSALFGFFVYPTFLISGNLESLEFVFNPEFILSYVWFSPVLLLSILNTAIGWLMASDTDDRDKQTGRYMAAAFLFMFYFMIMFGLFTPN